MLAYPGPYTHFDLTPAELPPGRPTLWSKRYHDTSGTQDQRPGRLCLRQWLGCRFVARIDSGSLALEEGHGLVASRLYPTPHRARAHHTATIPAQQPRRRGKRYKDRKRTAQGLEFSACPLMRLYPQYLIERGDLRDVTAVWTLSDAAAPAERPNQTRELTWGKALPA
jgi:hypothetical protein